MKKQRLVISVAIASLILACNLPVVTSSQDGNDQGQPGTTQVTATETQPALLPTETPVPVPSDTPTITPTPTPSVPMVTPNDKAVNCRFGPGQEYVPIGSGLAVGSSAQILGKSSGGGWWQIQNPSGGGDRCWVAASVTTASGDLATIGGIAAPEPFVTGVTVKVADTTIEVPGCAFPVSASYEGTITVNGPVKVKWHWELSQGVSS